MRYIIGGIGVLCIGYFGLANTLGGRIYFSEFFLILGIVCLVLYLMYHKIMKVEFIRKHMKAIKIFIVFILAVFLVVESAIILYPKRSEGNTDLIIVLGAGLKGTTPSLTLKHRLDTTIEYVEKTGYKGEIIVSGGQGQGEDISEAEAMKTYLMNKGIDDNRIVKEDKSTSTSENLKYSKEVIKNKLGYNVENNFDTTIITTDFHALRSNILAKRNGYENIKLYTSSTEWYLIPNMYTREFFAFVKSMIFDR